MIVGKIVTGPGVGSGGCWRSTLLRCRCQRTERRHAKQNHSLVHHMLSLVLGSIPVSLPQTFWHLKLYITLQEFLPGPVWRETLALLFVQRLQRLVHP